MRGKTRISKMKTKTEENRIDSEAAASVEQRGGQDALHKRYHCRRTSPSVARRWLRKTAVKAVEKKGEKKACGAATGRSAQGSEAGCGREAQAEQRRTTGDGWLQRDPREVRVGGVTIIAISVYR